MDAIWPANVQRQNRRNWWFAACRASTVTQLESKWGETLVASALSLSCLTRKLAVHPSAAKRAVNWLPWLHQRHQARHRALFQKLHPRWSARVETLIPANAWVVNIDSPPPVCRGKLRLVRTLWAARAKEKKKKKSKNKFQQPPCHWLFVPRLAVLKWEFCNQEFCSAEPDCATYLAF